RSCMPSAICAPGPCCSSGASRIRRSAEGISIEHRPAGPSNAPVPPLHAAAPLSRTLTAQPMTTHRAAGVEVPLGGRTREVTSLRARLAAAQSGRGSMALVAGEAGIGKTRLVHELERDAHAVGFDVLRGVCFDDEAAPPFAPWAVALGSLPDVARAS